jgi:acyl-CoA reductase-like NAD-dependent aldehyde dehydrogenase
VVNPSTGEVIAEAPLSSQPDVDLAVSSARKAFAKWSRTTPSERARALLAIADAIEDRADELAALESADAGKPLRAVLEEELPLCNLPFASLLVRHDCLRAGRPESTLRTARRSSAASQPACARRSRPGITRS